MAALTVQKITDTGAAPTFAQPTATDTANVGNGHNTFYVIKNTDGTNVKTVTITPPGLTEYGTAWPAKTVTVPVTNGEKWIPLRRAYANDLGQATIVISGAGGLTGVTAALVRVE